MGKNQNGAPGPWGYSALPNLPLWTSAPATTAMHAPSATGNALERLCYVLSNIEETEDGVISLNKKTTGIRDIKTSDAADGKIYTIDGRYVGRDLDRLGKGFYVKDGKKVAK